MSKKYKEGLKDGGVIAKNVINKIGDEVDIISERVEENAKKQGEINEIILIHLKELPFDFTYPSDAPETMSDRSKALLISSLMSVKDASDNPSDMAVSYFKSLYVTLSVPPIGEFDPRKLSSVDSKDADYILYILVEYRAFFEDASAINAADDIIKHINISTTKADEYGKIVDTIVEVIGLDGIICKHEFKADKRRIEELEDKVKYMEENKGADVTEEKDSDTDEASDIGSDPEGDSFALPPDDTMEQYPEIREIVSKFIPSICSKNTLGDRTKKQKKLIAAFINEHSLPVTVDTVIGIADTSITDSVKSGILFTTHAMYYHRSLLEKVIKIPYSNIDFAGCTLEHNKKGKPKAILISQTDGGTINISKVYLNVAYLLDMLNSLSKLPMFAPADSPQPIVEMDYSVKLPFVKYMVNFMTYSKQSTIELMRFACDIGFTDEQLSQLALYISAPKDSDEDILMQIDSNAPYGSRVSLKYALITEMFSQLQFVKSSSDLGAQEHEFIRKTAEVYGFSDSDIKNLKVVAQTKYKMITGKIKSVKELNAVQKAIKILSLVAGIPIVTIVGSSFLFFKTAWLLFVPVIGALISPALLGIAMIIINKVKNDVEFSKVIQETISKEKDSYIEAINRLSSLFPGMKEDIELLKRNFERL